MEIILVTIGLLSFLTGFVNHFLHMRYLKKHKPTIYNSLENKKSLIKLPIFMNLDLKKWWKYNFNFMNEKEKRIKLHKIIYIISLFIFMAALIVLLMNPVE